MGNAGGLGFFRWLGFLHRSGPHSWCARDYLVSLFHFPDLVIGIVQYVDEGTAVCVDSIGF